jgi:hypothetical protein
MAKKREKRECKAVVLEPDAAGIDIGAEEIYVAVPPDRDEESVRRFSSFTCDLHALADWLQQCRIRTVARESTGGVLDSSVSNPRSKRFGSLPGQRALLEECSWPQERCFRLPVDSVSALGWIAES